MKLRPSHNHRGFTLVELAIVLGVFAIILAGLWSLINLNRQKVRVQQTLDAISYTVDSVRSLYGAQASIAGGYPITGTITAQQGIPSNLVRPTSSTCGAAANAVTGNFADTPWAVTYNVCGSFRVCAWKYGTTTICGATAIAAQEYFTIELDQLDYGSCVALASGVYPTQPAGLVDVYITGVSAPTATSGAAISGNGLPAPTSWAMGLCKPNSTANTVDFVYRLRPPLS